MSLEQDAINELDQIAKQLSENRMVTPDERRHAQNLFARAKQVKKELEEMRVSGVKLSGGRVSHHVEHITVGGGKQVKVREYWQDEFGNIVREIDHRANLEDEEEKAMSQPPMTSLREIPAPEPPKQRVRCPEHGTWMKYHEEDDTMQCEEPGCDMMSQRARVFDDEWNVHLDEGKIGVYRGSMRFVRDEDGTEYLYLEGLRMLVEVTTIMNEAEEIQKARAEAAAPIIGAPVKGKIMKMTSPYAGNFMAQKREVKCRQQLPEARAIVKSVFSSE